MIFSFSDLFAKIFWAEKVFSCLASVIFWHFVIYLKEERCAGKLKSYLFPCVSWGLAHVFHACVYLLIRWRDN